MTVRLDTPQFQQSSRRGVMIFIYGLIWLAASVAGYLLIGPLFGAGENLILLLIIATWSAALAGAMGGATAMLNRLSRLSVEPDFLDHALGLYFVQPITGALVGILVLYLITIPAALLVNLVVDPGGSITDIFTASAFGALQILLAWVGGFHQELGLKKLKAASQRFISVPQVEPVASPSAPQAEPEPLLFREWYRQQQQVRRRSFTWGIFILGYGMLCLIGLLFSGLLAIRLFPNLQSGSYSVPGLVLAAWPVAVAGGMGGVLSMLRNLYDHVSIQRDFDRQYLISYLVQPALGAAFGFVIYFLVASGFLTLDAAANQDASPGAVEAPTLMMIQLVLGWVAGFRNQFVADLINQVVNRVVVFIKTVGKLLNPKTLFNKDRRNEVLGEIRNEAGPFKRLDLPTRPAVATDEGESMSDWFTQP